MRINNESCGVAVVLGCPSHRVNVFILFVGSVWGRGRGRGRIGFGFLASSLPIFCLSNPFNSIQLELRIHWIESNFQHRRVPFVSELRTSTIQDNMRWVLQTIYVEPLLRFLLHCFFSWVFGLGFDLSHPSIVSSPEVLILTLIALSSIVTPVLSLFIDLQDLIEIQRRWVGVRVMW